MGKYFINNYTWGDFLLLGLGLFALYLVFQFFYQLLKNTSFLGEIHGQVRQLLYYFLVVFEPLALLIVAGGLVLINPLYYGILVGVFIIVGFVSIRNYLNGIFIRLGNDVAEGNEIRIGNHRGIISEMKRTGVQLRTKEGLHFTAYSQMLRDGYTIISGEDVGGFYHLKIGRASEEDKLDSPIPIMDLLVMSPYIDWKFRPEIFPINTEPGQHETRVLIREEDHLHELIAVFKENGFSCIVKNN